MFTAVRPISCLIALALGWASMPAWADTQGATPTGVPRYAFVPGRELTYRSTSSARHWKDDKTSEFDSRGDVTVWVTAANPGGTYRLVIRQRTTATRTYGPTKQDPVTETTIS